ncbi:hypothetical protein CYMTET_13346 [Cymbomonas tetramitiformis]|uniref:Crossover junction endonuclease MUS81 n=1 Tax=Cymbomonas tetramitiformis TaxID=36881 RepID=A0AAE0LBA1_9CHLO|nr:hypothetical protein CYMTET_13346 [Cymbomonas tetramitiformis]
MAATSQHEDLRHKYSRGLSTIAQRFTLHHFDRPKFDACVRACVNISLHPEPLRTRDRTLRVVHSVGDRTAEYLSEIHSDRTIKSSPPEEGVHSSAAPAILVALLRFVEGREAERDKKDALLCPLGELLQRAQAICEQKFLPFDDILNGCLCASWQQITTLQSGGYIKERKRKTLKPPYQACRSGIVFELLDRGRQTARRLCASTTADPGARSYLSSSGARHRGALYANDGGQEGSGLLLLVDEREGGGDRHRNLSRLCTYLKGKGVRFETRELPTGCGDYMWVWRDEAGSGKGQAYTEWVVPRLIERKSDVDVAQSLMDGRWTRQKQAMKWAKQLLARSSGPCVLQYVVEGDVQKAAHPCACGCGGGGVGGCVRRGYPKVAEVQCAIDALPREGFEVQRTASLQKTAEYLSDLHKHLAAQSHSHTVQLDSFIALLKGGPAESVSTGRGGGVPQSTAQPNAMAAREARAAAQSAGAPGPVAVATRAFAAEAACPPSNFVGGKRLPSRADGSGEPQSPRRLQPPASSPEGLIDLTDSPPPRGPPVAAAGGAAHDTGEATAAGDGARAVAKASRESGAFQRRSGDTTGQAAPSADFWELLGSTTPDAERYAGGAAHDTGEATAAGHGCTVSGLWELLGSTTPDAERYAGGAARDTGEATAAGDGATGVAKASRESGASRRHSGDTTGQAAPSADFWELLGRRTPDAERYAGGGARAAAHEGQDAARASNQRALFEATDVYDAADYDADTDVDPDEDVLVVQDDMATTPEMPNIQQRTQEAGAACAWGASESCWEDAERLGAPSPVQDEIPPLSPSQGRPAEDDDASSSDLSPVPWAASENSQPSMDKRPRSPPAPSASGGGPEIKGTAAAGDLAASKAEADRRMSNAVLRQTSLADWGRQRKTSSVPPPSPSSPNFSEPPSPPKRTKLSVPSPGPSPCPRPGASAEEAGGHGGCTKRMPRWAEGDRCDKEEGHAGRCRKAKKPVNTVPRGERPYHEVVKKQGCNWAILVCMHKALIAHGEAHRKDWLKDELMQATEESGLCLTPMFEPMPGAAYPYAGWAGVHPYLIRPKPPREALVREWAHRPHGMKYQLTAAGVEAAACLHQQAEEEGICKCGGIRLPAQVSASAAVQQVPSRAQAQEGSTRGDGAAPEDESAAAFVRGMGAAVYKQRTNDMDGIVDLT